MSNARRLVFIALFGALLGLISQIALPLPGGIPLTLQTFAAALTGYLLGALSGTASVAVWLTLGAVGLPFFSGFQGGTAPLLGPAGGFLPGFLFLALCCGLVRNKSRWIRYGVGALGLLLCHGCGLAWFSFSSDTGILAGLLTVSLPYLLKDLLSLAGADACARLISRRVPSLRF